MREVVTVWVEEGPHLGARLWAARLLMRIAGMPFALKVLARGAAPEGPGVYYGKGEAQECVTVRPSGYFDGDLAGPLSLPAKPSAEVAGVPVLFGARSLWRGARACVIGGDLFASAFVLAGGVEEASSSERDEHGRFPAAASFAGRNNLLDRPLVDEYAQLLAEQARRLWPRVPRLRPWPSGALLAACVTHDIETLTQPTRLGYMRRSQAKAAEHLVKGVLTRAALHVGGGLLRGMTGTNPSWSFARLRAFERPFPGTYYFFGTADGKRNGRYDVAAPNVRKAIESLRDEDCEIGVHLSYESCSEVESMPAQKAAVEQAVGGAVAGARYHYLRAWYPQAWRALERTGFSYDATLGYAEAAGFRAGTSYPFEPFDVEAESQIDLVEVPLVAMDGSFLKYAGLSCDETIQSVLRLADTVACAGGVFTLLWHNTMVDPLDQPGPAKAYREITEALRGMSAWGATVGAVVERWKTYARSLEAPVG